MGSVSVGHGVTVAREYDSDTMALCAHGIGTVGFGSRDAGLYGHAVERGTGVPKQLVWRPTLQNFAALHNDDPARKTTRTSSDRGETNYEKKHSPNGCPRNSVFRPAAG